MKIQHHKYYSYDEIFDKYNSTKDRRFLSYAFIKKNNLTADILMKLFEVDFETSFLYIYNIQRELNGEKPIKTFSSIKEEDDINFDDMDDLYDF